MEKRSPDIYIGGRTMKAIVRALLIFVLVTLLWSCDKPTVIGYENEPIPTQSDPIQEPLSEKLTFSVERKEGSFTIQAQIRYQISARVKGSKSYARGWESSLSPVDLALAWGSLADRNFDRYISYSQRGRWYYYRYSADTPVDSTYITNHSCNNHLIPSTENIRRAVKTIKTNDLVEIEGYLVDVRGKVGDRDVWWNTSTSRTDSGARSCEIIYVEKIRINDKVYY